MKLKKFKSLTAFVLALLMTAAPGTSANAANNTANDAVRNNEKIIEKVPVEERYATNQAIVTFDSGLSDNKIDKILDRNDGEKEDSYLLNGEKVVLAESEESSAGEMIGGLASEKRVRSVQPNYIYRLKETDPFSVLGNRMYQYHFKMVKVGEAWEKVEASKKQTTKVAVLDTGVDRNHEDLKNVVKDCKMLVAGEVYESAEDISNHGTHVAGIIAAEYGNGKGGAGVASGTKNDLCDLMVYGVSENGITMMTYNVVAGIKDAVKNGAKVINMSFGSYYRDRLLESVIKKAYYDNGVTFVTAAGNAETDYFSSPSNMSEVISVCNCDEKGYKAYSTDYGMDKDITAPGTNIASTVPHDLYSRGSGTSMSAPVVTGACALVLDADPSLTPAQVRNIICGTAKQDLNNSRNYYFNNEMGYGLLDVQAAVSGALQTSTDAVSSIEIKESKTNDAVTVYTEDLDKGIYGENDNKYIAEGRGLEVLIKPVNSSAKIRWSSDDESIAKVDQNGYVKGIKAGESTTIHATAGGRTASVRVQVLKGMDPTGVKLPLNDDEKTIYVGESSPRLFEALEVEPSSLVDTEMYWHSSDKDVMTVDDQGIITARKPGKAVITVRTYNGKEASCEMTVKEPPADIEIADNTDWMVVGEKLNYKAVTKDSSGNVMPEAKIEWHSGNRTLANATEDGTVTAKKDGIFYLYAGTKWDAEEGGEISRYKKITITKKNYKGKDYSLKKEKVGRKHASVKWKEIPKASGYELFRANGKKGKFKKIKTLASSAGRYTDKSLKSGKLYVYKIRAKYTRNGKKGKYGFSDSLKIKTKKKSSKDTKKKAGN